MSTRWSSIVRRARWMRSDETTLVDRSGARPVPGSPGIVAGMNSRLLERGGS